MFFRKGKGKKDVLMRDCVNVLVIEVQRYENYVRWKKEGGRMLLFGVGGGVGLEEWLWGGICICFMGK